MSTLRWPSAVRAPRRVALVRLADPVLFAVFPLLALALLPLLFAHDHILALDFRDWYWPAGHRVLLGQSPYTQPYPWGLNYPAFTALAFVPAALIPRGVAAVLATVAAMAAVPVALRLLAVGDWRVYGAAMLWPPVVYGWQTANLSLLLVAGVAAAWRWRDRPVLGGLIVAAIVALKPVLWPLGLWLLCTRRWRMLAWAVAAAAVVTAGSFMVVGLGQLARYIDQLHRFFADAQRRSYSPYSLVTHLGGGHLLADATLVALTIAAAGACLVCGRRGSDRGALSAAIAATLVATPIVEAHYLAVVLVALALWRPRIGPLWVIGLALWVTPADWPAQWQRVVFLAVGAIVLLAPALPRRPGGGAAGSDCPAVSRARPGGRCAG
jgi:hypothetical protein